MDLGWISRKVFLGRGNWKSLIVAFMCGIVIDPSNRGTMNMNKKGIMNMNKKDVMRRIWQINLLRSKLLSHILLLMIFRKSLVCLYMMIIMMIFSSNQL